MYTLTIFLRKVHACMREITHAGNVATIARCTLHSHHWFLNDKLLVPFAALVGSGRNVLGFRELHVVGSGRNVLCFGNGSGFVRDTHTQHETYARKRVCTIKLHNAQTDLTQVTQSCSDR